MIVFFLLSILTKAHETKKKRTSKTKEAKTKNLERYKKKDEWKDWRQTKKKEKENEIYANKKNKSWRSEKINRNHFMLKWLTFNLLLLSLLMLLILFFILSFFRTEISLYQIANFSDAKIIYFLSHNNFSYTCYFYFSNPLAE